MLVAVSAPTISEQFARGSVDVDGDGFQVSLGAKGNDVEILKADRVRVRDQDSRREVRQSAHKTPEHVGEFGGGITQPEPIRIPTEKRNVRHVSTSLVCRAGVIIV